MKRFLLVPVAAMLIGLMPIPASAHSSVFFGLNLGLTPFNSFSFGYGGGRRGYRSAFAFNFVAPPIYYAAPAAVYAPAPAVVYAPAPSVVYAPAPVYAPAYAAPTYYYYSAPAYSGYYYGGRGYYYGR